MSLFDWSNPHRWWELKENFIISHEVYDAWVDHHALDECDDPFDALDWMACYNIRRIMEEEKIEKEISDRLYGDLRKSCYLWESEEDFPSYFTYEEFSWVDCHALDECNDPFEAFSWICHYNSKEFLEKMGKWDE